MALRFDFFSIDTYNRLPSLSEAHAVFIDNDDEEVLREFVQPMMQVESVFAINLVYIHNIMQRGQRVVGMEGSSRPLVCDSDRAGTLRSLLPVSWTITSDGRMMEREWFSCRMALFLLSSATKRTTCSWAKFIELEILVTTTTLCNWG